MAASAAASGSPTGFGGYGYGGFGGGIGIAYGADAGFAPFPGEGDPGIRTAPSLPALGGIRPSPVEPAAIYVVGEGRRTGSARPGANSVSVRTGAASGPLLIRIERGGS
jgi:hypothetical protein